MCEYCNNNVPIYEKFYGLRIFVINNKLSFCNDDGEYYIDIDFEINFCPMCGRKLKEY